MPRQSALQPPTAPTLFALGFRPFFLAAGAAALLAIPGWLGILHGILPIPDYYGATTWHAHVMLFGYTAAVIAGFLLTAVRNWTGLDTPTGWPLAILLAIWIAARLAPFLPVPGWLVALVDLAFLPLLALGLARPLWHGGDRTNRVFLLLLGGMTVAGVLVHLDRLDWMPGLAPRGHRLMLDLTILTLLIISGRVMPFFTEQAIDGAQSRNLPWAERLTFALATLMVGLNLGLPASDVAGAATLALAAVQIVRVWAWHDRRVWRLPILWVLYTGYLWLIVGLMLGALAAFGYVAHALVLHTLTVGAVGVFTLGMMARVALGHTGRAMRATPPTVLAFVLLNLAAAVRVLGPLLDLASYHQWLLLSGGLWAAAFGIFVWIYAPILTAPRADGRPG